MIEFRAECGHTVRAKDHDAGEVVRCTYCGREVQVPLPEDRSLEHLLGQASAAETASGRAGRSPMGEVRQWVSRHDRWVRGGVTVLYLAVVLVVVAYGASWVAEVLSHSTQSPPPTLGTEDDGVGAPPPRPRRTVTAASNRRPAAATPDLGPAFAGLNRQQSGLAVESVPANARVYVALAGEGGTSPAAEEKNFKGAAPIAVSLPPGQYVVALAMPVTEKALQRFPDYRTFRHELERTQDIRSIRNFFLADEAEALTLSRSGRGPLMITRNYRAEVPARAGAWTAVTGLFLPDLPPSRLVDLLPEVDRYTIDAEHAADELDFYDVALEERDAALTMLRRIGKLVVGDTRGDRARVFQMQPSGEMWSDAVTRAPAGGPGPASESAPGDEKKGPIEQIRDVQHLAEATKLTDALRRSEASVDVSVWTMFLPGGSRQHVYKAAPPAERAGWIDLIDSDDTSALVSPLGELLLEETDAMEVRRAITEALVRLGDPAAVEYFNKRLRLLSGMKKLTLALREERSRLVRAKNALKR